MSVTSTITPNGNTVAIVASSVSSSTSVTSLTPGNKWQVVNTGANPVQTRFYVNTSTGTATFPVWGTPSLGPVVGAASAQVVELPAALQPQVAGLGGFTSTVVVAAIATTGSNPVYITPVL
jgi:hypothetical protein